MLKQKLLVNESAAPAPVTTGVIYTLGNSDVRGGTSGVYLSLPNQLGSAAEWVSVASEQSAAYYIKSDGTLWYTGIPGGGLSAVTVLTQAGVATNWKAVNCGWNFSIAVKTDGTLWSWGSNGNAGPGQGTTVGNTTFATQVGSATDWATVGSHFYGSFAIKTDGTLWSWGSNTNYATGLGTNSGTTNSPTQVGSATDWAKLGQSAMYCGFAIKTTGTLWSWGSGLTYQLGNGSTGPRPAPTQVGAATNWFSVGNAGDGAQGATCATRTNGTLWSWGGNVNAGTAQGTIVGNTTAVTQVGVLTTWLLVSGGSLYSISAFKNDYTLWAWGANSAGTTGQNTLSGKQSTPAQIGLNSTWFTMVNGVYSLILLATPFVAGPGKLFGFGGNSAGQLGDGGTSTVTTPTQSGVATNWVKVIGCIGGGDGGITFQHGFSFGIKDDGTLWAWGNNGDGQLGIGSTINQTSPVQVGSATWSNVVAVSSGWASFALGVRTDGTLWGWGNNIQYQLGTGTTTNSTSPVQVGSATDWLKVSANGNFYKFFSPAVYFAIALKTTGTLWSWGSNGDYGCTGQGVTTGNTTTPTQIGSDNTWTDISCGGDGSYRAGGSVDSCFALATRSNGTLWGWGANANNQLGNGTTTPQSSPVQIGSITNWFKVFAGSGACAFAINNAGQLYSWGVNRDGQTGLGTTAGNTTTPTIIGSATIWQQVSHANAASSGQGFVIGIRTDGTLWTWGLNSAYNLGNGSTSPVNFSSPTQVGALTTWSYAAAGGQYLTSSVRLSSLAVRT